MINDKKEGHAYHFPFESHHPVGAKKKKNKIGTRKY